MEKKYFKKFLKKVFTNKKIPLYNINILINVKNKKYFKKILKKYLQMF